jgi:hypothetical protein
MMETIKSGRQKHAQSRAAHIEHSKSPERDNRSRKEPSSIDSSALSLEDESSFNLSDYSISSRDELSPGSSKCKRHHLSSHGKLGVVKNAVRSASTPHHVTKISAAISSTGSSSFSSGSPWFDDSDSSSSTSSIHDLKIMPSVWKREDPSRVFDVPPTHGLTQTQKKVPLRRSNSASSVNTGMDPSKPIDLTSTPDIGIVPTSLLEHVRRSRVSMDSKDSLLKAQARIVGIATSLQEVGRSKDFQPSMSSRKQSYGMARPVPPMLIPEFCTAPDDDMSSLEANISDSKVLPLHLHHGPKNHSNTAQQRVNARIADEENSVGWIEQRTNMELCLIFSVATTLLALSILLAFMLKE